MAVFQHSAVPGTKLQVDYSALEALQSRLLILGSDTVACEGPIASSHDAAMAGAEGFQEFLEPGAVAFLLAWREVVQVAAESIAVVGHNIGAFSIDIKATDL